MKNNNQTQQSSQDTLPEKKKSKKLPQLSNKAIQEMIRPHAIEAVEKLLDIMHNGSNDNVKLGAIKILLSKILPDLKSTDITTEEGLKFLVEIVNDNKLKDANTTYTASSQALPSTIQDIRV